jgi:hypothetical protein
LPLTLDRDLVFQCGLPIDVHSQTNEHTVLTFLARSITNHTVRGGSGVSALALSLLRSTDTKPDAVIASLPEFSQ